MKGKLLLTGASGFIGSQIYKSLKDDFEITALTSSSKNDDFTFLNLLDKNACNNFFRDIKYDFIIHAAAIAHGKNNVNTMSVGEANIDMTKNIFDSLDLSNTTVIFLSSVSVYSFKNNKDVISINDKPFPVTEYGKSKLVCEKLLADKKLRSLHILRLTPVYSENNLNDLGKRVFLPIFKTSFFTKQERFYSLCSVNQVVVNIKNLIKSKENSLTIVKDNKDYSQKDLLAFFNIQKPKITINRNIIKPLLFVLSIIPVSKVNVIRDMFDKLLYSGRYTN